MTKNECLFGYFEMMKICCTEFGIPQSIYSDKHTIFRSPKTDKLSIEEEINGKKVNLTQFGRAMHELGTDIIYANSPQAKGRVERLWVTLQSRLLVEFARKGIKDIDGANKFLREYMHEFNRKFSVEPENTGSLFIELREEENIDNFLCIKNTRKMDSTGVFSFKNRAFQIVDEGFPLISSKSEVTVFINPNFGIKVEYKGKVYNTVHYIRPARKMSKAQVKSVVSDIVGPHLKHNSEEWRKIWWYEDYNQSLKFLFELFFDNKKFIS